MGPPAQQSGGQGGTALVQDDVLAYRLKQSVLENYLKRKFPVATYGHIQFNLKQINDSWTFWVPRVLDEDEKDDEIDELREKDNRHR